MLQVLHLSTIIYKSSNNKKNLKNNYIVKKEMKQDCTQSIPNQLDDPLPFKVRPLLKSLVYMSLNGYFRHIYMVLSAYTKQLQSVTSSISQVIKTLN